jgi:hypothetical protein
MKKFLILIIFLLAGYSTVLSQKNKYELTGYKDLTNKGIRDGFNWSVKSVGGSPPNLTKMLRACSS